MLEFLDLGAHVVERAPQRKCEDTRSHARIISYCVEKHWGPSGPPPPWRILQPLVERRQRGVDASPLEVEFAESRHERRHQPRDDRRAYRRRARG